MIKSFLMPGTNARPVAFWFLNHYLEKTEINYQIDKMYEMGLGGIMLHPRDGLRTDYLSEKFAAMLECAICRAEKYEMSVWLYDELHFPSGAAGFKLELYPEKQMQTLRVTQEKELLPGETFTPTDTITLAVNPYSGCCRTLTTSIPWNLPSNWESARIFEMHIEQWQSNAISLFDAYPDYTDPELTDKFISITHQWYTAHFASRFGKTIRGIFSDNSCGNFGAIRRGIPWGRNFPDRFREYTGEEIFDHLPGLLDRDLPNSRRSRLLFWDFFGHAYLDNYFHRITDYCTRVNLLSTGHLACEDGMAEHVRQIGDYFEVMRNFSYCAVDNLGPRKKGASLTNRGEDGNLSQKMTSSSARFLGREEVMCECLGLASQPWELTLSEIRRITGWHIAMGTNVFVPHGLFYSIAGSRKWECPPDHFHNPISKQYRGWTDWISRLSMSVRGGVNRAGIAVIYPITALQANIELGKKCANGTDWGEPVSEIERIFRKTVDTLVREHLDFEIIDEKLLAGSEILPDGNMLLHSRASKFDMKASAIILAATDVLHQDAIEKLREFMRAGGNVLQLGLPLSEAVAENKKTIPCKLDSMVWKVDEPLWHQTLKRLVSVTDSTGAENGNIVCRNWEKDGANWYFLFNHSTEKQQVKLSLPNTEKLYRMDLETGKFHHWSPTDENIVFLPAEGLLLTSLPIAIPEPELQLPRKKLTLPVKWHFHAEEGNLFPLRNWQTRVDDSRHIHTFHFQMDFAPMSLRLLLDLEFSRCELSAGHFSKRVTCLINHSHVTEFRPGERVDRYIREAEIAPWVKIGDNVLEIQCDSLLNEWEKRLCPPILCGDFTLSQTGNSEWVIQPPIETICRGSWTEQGYPFFCGEGCYSTTVSLPPYPVQLELDSRCMVAELLIEGNRVGVRVAPPYVFDLTAWQGKTVAMCLKIINTPNNLFMDRSHPAGLF
ncbi:MAG: hypothetical protein ACI4UV_08510 [Victivallales bacterium]